MKRRKWILILALPLSIALGLLGVKAIQKARQQQELSQKISDLQNEASALRAEENFVEALNTLERLQVLLMNAGKYQDALATSFTMEEWSGMCPERKSPWNYLRIAEAYLGLGDKRKCLEWMEKAVQERNFLKLDYFQNDRFGALKDDPRYKKMMAACEAHIGLGREAKDFRIPLLDGSSFALSAQKGKVVLVDFWDVRCGPCRKEMPNLKEIFSDFNDRGLEIVGISLDTDKQLLEDYLREAALPWKIACTLRGWSDETAKLYNISATPSTWLIDRKGIVRYYDARGTKLRQAVEELIDES